MALFGDDVLSSDFGGKVGIHLVFILMRRNSSSVDSELSYLVNVIFLAVSLLVPILISLVGLILRILI